MRFPLNLLKYVASVVLVIAGIVLLCTPLPV